MSSGGGGGVGETTPLLTATATAGSTQHQRQGHDQGQPTRNRNAGSGGAYTSPSLRVQIYEFLEAKTDGGRWYELFMMILIGCNVVAFVLASLFVPEYNTDAAWAQRGVLCGDVCDALWFGNFQDNALQKLQLGSTSVLEIVTVLVFTIEYGLRLCVADLETPIYAGWKGRLFHFVPSFFSVVDLASTLPFYIDSFVLRHSDLGASSAFLRMFRLLRMMRVEGRYDTALTMVDDVWRAQRAILGTALFVGVTTWLTVSALYYLTERRNLQMIYCGAAPSYCTDNGNDIDTSLCTIDVWGFTNCTLAGCPPTAEVPQPCYNLYHSIPSASYFALLNLFGEFPLLAQYSPAGQVVGTITAVVAVAVFALPAGIIGNGFESVIAERRRNAKLQQQQQAAQAATQTQTQAQQQAQLRQLQAELQAIDDAILTPGHSAPTTTQRGRLYNFLHAQNQPGSVLFDHAINVLILVTAVSFMLDTVPRYQESPVAPFFFDSIELFAVLVFTVEYCLRVYSCVEDPKYHEQTAGPYQGRFKYMCNFLPLVDFLSFVPYWIQLVVVATQWHDVSSQSHNVVKALRLLRILRFEKYTHAFTTFDDVLRDNMDVLAVTAFTAFLCWIFFAALLYYTERDNPDDEMASNYSNVPNSLWITLLNLSGESPLCNYSIAGKIVTGILGLFATGIFGIPIGVLGAGFEAIVAQENSDNQDAMVAAQDPNGNNNNNNNNNNNGNNDNNNDNDTQQLGTWFDRACFQFVNGMGSRAAQYFEILIYALIFAAVAVGVWQTVEGQENSLHQLEWVAVIIFTIEYSIRLVGAGADPEFASPRNGRGIVTWFFAGIVTRAKFVVSFYSIVDLLAIVPFYIAWSLPHSVVNQYDEYLRMLRIVRLVKLDKYIPSITLIDDVIRLKFSTLRVAFYAAVSLWILFAAGLFLSEYKDTANELDDNLPQYGCIEDCTMADRFQTFFDSMVYTGVHLTGDYPIVTYSWPGRLVNFFMVIAAVGVVSVPSGLIASGFVEIIQSKNKRRNDELAAAHPDRQAGDDWYEISYRELEGSTAPPSAFGPDVDKLQYAVNEFLNGKKTEDGKTEWTRYSSASRIFIFTVIIGNVVAILLESIPTIDRAVGNEPGNFFDVFEVFSVMVFALEYILRLFCAPKNREALYSSWVYATTFFGIVDFLSTAPWFIEQALFASGIIQQNNDNATIFRMFRIFRVLQLEDFVVAFSKLDNVFRASKDVLKATGLMALIIWVGCGALFYIFEENNPNWRECDASIPLSGNSTHPGCYDFASTAACNDFYPGLCSQSGFYNMPNALFYTAVFLGGEWGVVDFTWPGRFVCLFLCVVGIGLYAIPIGTLFDSFGAVLGLGGDDDDEEEEQEIATNGKTEGEDKK